MMKRHAIFIFCSITFACASGKPTPHGSGGSGGGSVDGAGADSEPAVCKAGKNICVDKKIYECDSTGHVGSIVEACSDACSLGRCTTSACAVVEATRSTNGCLFYGVDIDNTEFDDALVFGFPLGNPGGVPVNVRIEKSTGKDTWPVVVSGMVMPGEINYFRIALGPFKGDDYHIEGTGRAYKAYRISSDAPIVAYQINSDDEIGSSASSGSTLLLPLQVLGTEHFAMTPPDRGMPAGSGQFAYGPDHSFIDIIGIKNGTKVIITVKSEVMAGGPIMAMAKDELRSFIINEGEVLQLETPGKGNDLSGSEITSDQPVVVYAGNVCGGFDAMRLYFKNCDHIEEAMYPVNTWGTNFVFLDMRMPIPAPSKAIWGRIVASEDGTTITFDAPRTLIGLPMKTVLDRGEVLALEITDVLTASNRAHFSINSDKPIEVESFMGEDEGGAVIIPTGQFLDDYLISTHPWFTAYVMVTRKIGTPVMLDGVMMDATLFTPGGSGYEVSFVAMPRCEMALDMCDHRIVGSNVGVSVTANGGVCNYCYAGGAGAKCINKTVACY